MNDDLQPDALDDELRRRFASGTDTGSDPDAVLDTMRPQLARARTRRRASFASAIAGVAVIVVVLAFALGGGGGSSKSVHTPPAHDGPVNTVPPAPTTAGVGGSVTPDTVASGTNGGGFVNPDPTTPGAGDSPQTSTPTEVTPTTGPAAPADSTYTSDGGSIVVHFENGRVSLVSSSPAPGFTAEVHDNGPSRVEVRFSNGQIEWRIRVDVVNGQLVPEITPH